MRKVPIIAAIATLAALSAPLASAQESYNNRYNNSGGSSSQGFFRERNDRTVYYQYERRSFCGIQNQEQLRALGGGSDQVQIVDRLRLSGNNTGACSWPNGFYRRNNSPAVFMLQGYGNGPSGSRVCEIGSPQQLRSLGGNNRVIVVPGNSDLQAGRQPSRPC